ncbi:hypothetical protein [Kitasatospora sp. NPDC101183]|uniref:hypothetical protein n=1 Tax=Kitasatospora sp. NPDC101183 TaxID=3364100 RepID=UPI00381B229E
MPEPAEPPPALRRDAVVVPVEMTGVPAPDGAGRCWQPAWIRAGGRWTSALVTERRRPGPDLPWIAHARWGEDRDAAWTVADDLTLLPARQPSPDADGRAAGSTASAGEEAPAGRGAP